MFLAVAAFPAFPAFTAFPRGCGIALTRVPSVIVFEASVALVQTVCAIGPVAALASLEIGAQFNAMPIGCEPAIDDAAGSGWPICTGCTWWGPSALRRVL